MSSISDRRKAKRRQERYVKPALDYFRGEMPGTFKGRSWATHRIRDARQPMTEARRLVEWFRRQDIADTVDADDIGFDSVQEIRTRIVRRDGIVDRPQAMLLARMDRLIATGEMDRAKYDKLAGAVLAMPLAFPKSKIERM